MKGGRRNAHAGKVALPGDRIQEELPKTGKLRLGPGLKVAENRVVATSLGVVNQSKSGKLWLQLRQKRYTPAVDESVVGIVQDRNAEAFLVEIRGACYGELPLTSFENVTKRNVPPLKPGDLVHARVTTVNPFTNPALSCVDSNGKAGGLGVLKGGMTLHVCTSFARALLSTPLHPVLSLLGEKLKFEIVVGMNGRLWFWSETLAQGLLLRKVLSACDGLSRSAAVAVCTEALRQHF